MRTSKIGRISAVVLGLSLVAAACGSDDEEASETTAPAAETTAPATETTGASGGVTCDPVSIGFLGALSGDNGALGQNMVNGAKVAFAQFNEANPDCQVTFDFEYDSQGDPAQATPLADTIANDESIIGLVGPGFSGETRAVMPTFEEFGLPVVSASATNATLSQEGWTMFHRALASDDLQGPGVAKLITEIVKGESVGIVDDASDYGKGLAASVTAELGDLVTATATIDPDAADYSDAVTAMADVDTVFFSGYYAAAAKLVTQLRDAGSEAIFVSGDGTLDINFVTNAGAASEGAYITATGAPPDVNADFAAAYGEANGGALPGLYGPESYDAANIFLAGIAAGNVTREDMAAFIDSYDAPGITKQLKFDETGEPEGSNVFYTVVEGGELVSKGLIP